MGHFSSKLARRGRYILKEFLFTRIEEEDIGNIWYQQDGNFYLLSEILPETYCEEIAEEILFIFCFEVLPRA